MLIVIGQFLQFRQRNAVGVFLVLPVVEAVQRRHLLIDVAVQRPQLIEKAQEVAGRADRGARRTVQNAARQHRHQALDVLALADRRHRAHGPQDARLLQRRELQQLETIFVAHQRQQRRGRGRRRPHAGQDAGAQGLRLIADEGHELVARHRRGGGEHAEAERNERDDVPVGHRLVLVVLADEIHLIEHAAHLRIAARHLVLERRPPVRQPARTVREFAVQFGSEAGNFLAEGLESAVVQAFQARIGLDVEREPGEATRRLVEQEARCRQLAVGVHDRFEIVVRHVGVGAGGEIVRIAAHVGREAEVRQAVDHVVVVELRHADLEVSISGVQISQVLQGYGIGFGVAGEDGAGAADANRHVRLHRALHQEAVGDDRLLAVRIGDDEIVLAVRGAGQVEDRDDLAAVDDLVADGLELGDPGPRQFHRRLG